MNLLVVELCELTGRGVVCVHWSYSGMSLLFVEWYELVGHRVVHV